jgi:hypothetical protein
MLRIPVLALATIMVLSLNNPAYAYVDPGSGSIIASAVVGFFAAITYTFRKTFYRIKDMIFRGNSKSSPGAEKRDDF